MSAGRVGHHREECHRSCLVLHPDGTVAHEEQITLADVAFAVGVEGLVVAGDGVLGDLDVAVGDELPSLLEGLHGSGSYEDVEHEGRVVVHVGRAVVVEVDDVAGAQDVRVEVGLPGLGGHRRLAENLGRLVNGDQPAEVLVTGDLPLRNLRHRDGGGRRRSGSGQIGATDGLAVGGGRATGGQCEGREADRDERANRSHCLSLIGG